MAFQSVMEQLGVTPLGRNRMMIDGMTSIQELVIQFKNDVGGVKDYFDNLNKTFANARTQLQRVYYAPPVVTKIMGLIHYCSTVYHVFHQIPNLASITNEMCMAAYQQYKAKKSASSNDDSSITIPVFKGTENYVKVRKAFMQKLSQTSSVSKYYNLDYVVDDTPRAAVRAISAREEINVIDINDDELFKSTAVHFGNTYKQDRTQVYNMLKEILLNTPGYNHISSCDNAKDGRKAFTLLRQFYEGEDFKKRMLDKGISTLTNTFYNGETARFSFERFIEIHKEAHEQVKEGGYNSGLGLDEAATCLYLKSGIRGDSGLDNQLSTARAGGTKFEQFDSLVSYLQAEVDHKNIRRAQLKRAKNRNVSGVNHNNNGNKKKKKGNNQNNNNNPSSELVDGKRVYGRHYPVDEFKALTKNQRAAIARLRKADKSKSSSKDNDQSISALRTEIRDDLTQMENRIIAGVSRAAEEDDSIVEPTPASTRASTDSGSVGGYIGSRRNRRGSN
jgi:hypothetical protein